MQIQTATPTLQMFFNTDAVPASFPSDAPQTSPPETGTIELGDGGSGGNTTANYGRVVLWATGGSGLSFSAKLVGWSQIFDRVTKRSMWICQPIVNLSCTTGTTTGPVGGDPIDNTRYMVSAITISSGTPSSLVIPSDSQIGVASVVVDLTGFQRVTLEIGPGSGVSAANGALGGF